MAEEDCCWVCLAGSEAGPLSIPCLCPSHYSHAHCLARWNLQNAGREEEAFCRFCSAKLPPWSANLLAEPPARQRGKAQTPIMAVVFNGRCVKLPCLPGREGADLFKKQVRQIFGLDDSVNLDVTFELKVPTLSEDQGQKVFLKGFETFEAASTVAAICAARRQSHGPPAGASSFAPLSSSAPICQEPGPSTWSSSRQRAATGPSRPLRCSPVLATEMMHASLPGMARSLSLPNGVQHDSDEQQQQQQQLPPALPAPAAPPPPALPAQQRQRPLWLPPSSRSSPLAISDPNHSGSTYGGGGPRFVSASDRTAVPRISAEYDVIAPPAAGSPLARAELQPGSSLGRRRSDAAYCVRPPVAAAAAFAGAAVPAFGPEVPATAATAATTKGKRSLGAKLAAKVRSLMSKFHA